MANAKVTALPEGTALAATDVLYVVVDPGTTPVSKKATIANVLAASGTIAYTDITASGLITAGNFTTAGTIGAGAITSSALLTGANIHTAGTIGSGAITSSGVVSAGNFTSLGTAGIHNALTVHSLVNEGAYSGFGTVGMHGAVTVHSLVDEGAFTALGTAGVAALTTSGLLTAANITTAGTIGAGTVTASGGVHAGGAANYTNIDAGGHLQMFGTATTFLDEFYPLIGQKLESPSSDIVQSLAEGALEFKTSATLADYVVMPVQINHDWKVASNIFPHLHWWQTSTAVPNWLLLHRWEVQGSAKTDAWSTMAWTSHAFSYASGTFNQISLFGTITPPANAGLSDILQVRLLRDTANDSAAFGTVDGLSASVYAVSLAVHKEVDTLGSNSEYSK